MKKEDLPIKDILETPFHHWKPRLYVGLLMLLLAFIGVIVTNIRQDGAWNYWRVICVIFALLSLGLSLFIRKRESKEFIVTIWHEIFHWVGLFLAVSLVSMFVKTGVLPRLAASLEILSMLALATFLAGVYIEITFIIIGVCLGLFALGLSLATTYLLPIAIPLLAIGGLVLWFYLKKKHSHHKIS